MQGQDTHRLSGSILIAVQGPHAVCRIYCSPGFTTTFPAAWGLQLHCVAPQTQPAEQILCFSSW